MAAIPLRLTTRTTTSRRRIRTRGCRIPLKLANGKPVKSATDWWKKRRPELVEIYDREIYGRMPANVPGVTWSVQESREDVVGGKPVVFRKLVGPRRQLDLSTHQRRHRSRTHHAEGREARPGHRRVLSVRIPRTVSAATAAHVAGAGDRARAGRTRSSRPAPSRPTMAPASRKASSDSSTRGNRAHRMTGEACAPGPGAHHGCSTISKRIPKWTRNEP